MQFRKFIKLALATAVGLTALQSMTAVAQEIRSEISVQAQGFSLKTATATGFKTMSPTQVDFWSPIVKVKASIVGLQPKPITAMTGIHRSTSAADSGECNPMFTKSTAKPL